MKTNKALVALVIGLGVVIVLGMGVIAYGLAQKAADPSFRFFATTPSDAPKDATKGTVAGADISVPLPVGTSVVSVTRADDLLMVHTVDEEDASAVLFIDLKDGRIVRRIVFGARR